MNIKKNFLIIIVVILGICTIFSIAEYANDGKRIKRYTWYDSVNDLTIDCIDEFDSNGKTTKTTSYYPDGKTIYSIAEYANGNLTKITYYYPDGKTIKSITEHGPNEKITKSTYYHPDGTIK